MQKVVGSSPIIRFGKSPCKRGLFVSARVLASNAGLSGSQEIVRLARSRPCLVAVRVGGSSATSAASIGDVFWERDYLANVEFDRNDVEGIRRWEVV
jgi:hypothetical protein